MKIDGPRLRRVREDAGLTLTDLANQASVTKGYLSRIERSLVGDVSPPVTARLAKALGLAVVDLRDSNEAADSGRFA